MKTAYIIFLLLIFNFLSAQQPQWQWANRGGSLTQPGNGNQNASIVVADTAGNSYATGVINSNQASFANPYGPPYVTTYGGVDIFLAKYDCAGNLVWVDILGSPGDDCPNGLEIGKDGMIYLFGCNGNGNTFHIKTNSAVDSFSFLTAATFFAKFNTDGSLNKFNKFDNVSTGNLSTSNYLAMNSKGNFIIIGTTFAGQTFLNLNTTLLYGEFIAEVDTSLTPLWAKNIQGTLHINAAPLFTTFTLDSSDNIFFAGSIENADTVEFGGQLMTMTSGAVETAVVMKFDSGANYMWDRIGTSVPYDGANYPIVDAEGNLIFYGGTNKGDTILGFPFNYSGNASFMISFLKLNKTTGNLMYGIIGNNNSTLFPQAGFDLKYGLNNNFYVADQLKGNLVFDSISVTTSTTGNPLIWEFTDDGTAFHATTNYSILNGNGLVNQLNSPNSIACNQQGNVYLGGTFSGAIYTPNDTIEIANGGEQTDIFIAKFGLPCGDTNSLIPPLAPSNLVATATGPQAITVTWQNNAQYVQRFRIYRSLDAVTWAVIDSVPANITTYIDVNVQQSVVYWYKASAVNNVGESQFTNSDSAEIIPQAIADMAQNNIQMLIQPNPNKGNFTLTLATNADANAQLTIYNVDGQQVLAQPVQIVAGNNWYPIQMPDVPAGVYIVQINGENGGMGRGKFVKE